MIALEKPNKKVWSALKEEWPGRQHYILDERIAFIAPPSLPFILTDDVCEALGIDETDQVTGVVLEVPKTISGWHENTFWEWMDKVSS
ncbi:MAG: hypothetical protein OXC18_02695 [Desulfurellaceae bacterium]|nr:hypothetical protein [Desulfurellaceae bacterium]